MLKHGRNLKSRYARIAAGVIALMLAFGPGAQQAQAGMLAQLRLQAAASKTRAVAVLQHHVMELCVGVARGASCGATFESALRATQAGSARGRLYESLTANRAAPGADGSELQHQIVLKFNEDPEWKRRAKVLAHDGLPFLRMPQGPNHELLVGITPHGMFGVSLKDTTGE